LVYGGRYSPLDASLRLVDFGFVVAFFAWAFRRLSVRDDPLRLSSVAGSLALILAFLFLTLELNTFLTGYVPALRSGGISILWSLFALGLIIGGIYRSSAALRGVGLALFLVVGFKVFLIDLATLDQFYRIIAFILLGVLALCGAFLYLRFRQTFAKPLESVDKEVLV
jgi:uncharacterized membrane protein